MVMSETQSPKRKPGEHGALPLSRRTRTRILGNLMRRAEAGDAEAAAALVLLSYEIEEMQREPKGLDVKNAVAVP